MVWPSMFQLNGLVNWLSTGELAAGAAVGGYVPLGACGREKNTMESGATAGLMGRAGDGQATMRSNGWQSSVTMKNHDKP